jgi:hypothetical protein
MTERKQKGGWYPTEVTPLSTVGQKSPPHFAGYLNIFALF